MFSNGMLSWLWQAQQVDGHMFQLTMLRKLFKRIYYCGDSAYYWFTIPGFTALKLWVIRVAGSLSSWLGHNSGFYVHFYCYVHLLLLLLKILFLLFYFIVITMAIIIVFHLIILAYFDRLSHVVAATCVHVSCYSLALFFRWFSFSHLLWFGSTGSCVGIR